MIVTFDQDVYHRIVYMFNGAFYKVELLFHDLYIV